MSDIPHSWTHCPVCDYDLTAMVYVENVCKGCGRRGTKADEMTPDPKNDPSPYATRNTFWIKINQFLVYHDNRIPVDGGVSNPVWSQVAQVPQNEWDNLPAFALADWCEEHGMEELANVLR